MDIGKLRQFNPQTAMNRFEWAKKTAQSGESLPTLNSVDGTLFRLTSDSQKNVDTVQIRGREDMVLETLTYDRKTLMHCVKPPSLAAKEKCVTHQLSRDL